VSIAEVIGVAGFVGSLVALWWQWRDRRPQLAVSWDWDEDKRSSELYFGVRVINTGQRPEYISRVYIEDARGKVLLFLPFDDRAAEVHRLLLGGDSCDYWKLHSELLERKANEGYGDFVLAVAESASLRRTRFRRWHGRYRNRIPQQSRP
jgi:hypothetical protein